MSTREILLLEDNTTVRSALSELLTAAGLSVHSVATVEAGVALAKILPRLDAVITDVVMPEDARGGVALIKALRANAATANVPVILTTALSASDIMGMTDVRGPSQILQKPYAMPELLRALERV